MSGLIIKEFNNVKNNINFSKLGTIPDEIYDYFYLLPKPYDELFGKDIITTFYSTKYLFKKLEDYYEMMINLIEINKDKLNKDISRNNYRFDKSNFIFFGLLTQNYNDDFNNLFNLSMQNISSAFVASINKNEKDFVLKFQEIDGVFNCLSKKKNPFFLNLFDENYNGKDKDFFMDLFKEYSSIRQQIFKVADLKGNAGILSLEPFLINNIETNLNNNVKQNAKKNNDNNKNNFKNSLFFNSSNKNIYKGINIPAPATGLVSSSSSKTKTKVVIDRRDYSLFYKKNLTNSTLDFSTKIHEIFEELHKNISEFVLFDRGRPLCDILLKSIRIDYLSLKFFYSFIESIKFKIITDSAIKINSYIYRNIELYKQYLPAFLSWKETYVNSTNLSKSIINSSKQIDKEELIFQKTLEQFFTNWVAKTDGIKKIKNKDKNIVFFSNGIKLLNKSLKPKTKLNRMEEYV